ncbi:MAG: GGDEF domain-containing protein [Planctomycetaceae bacterium]|nr:GGDEF domain-containing protein [Planctomycetaceae bacterium]
MDSPVFATMMLTPAGQTPTSPSQQWLIQLHPLDLEQSKIPINGDCLIIGRSEFCDLQLDDHWVSRQHAKIQRVGAGFEIRDLGSTNGLSVNDQQVPVAELQSGDRIRIGKRIFRFLSDADVESKYYETVYSMMTRDGLTGAYNKRYLMEFLEREILRSRRFSRHLSLILFDVDHFKSINDTYGHLAGDDVLRELAKRVQATIGAEEVLSRFGGEEFAIVAELSLTEAAALAELCRQQVSVEPFSTSNGFLEVTISLGVAQLPRDFSGTPQQLLSLADELLYAAKRSGRNRVCHSS